MAQENKYVNSLVAAGSVAPGYKVRGHAPVVMREVFEVAAADDDGSIYRVFPNVSPELVPVDIRIWNDAISGGTDYDLGLYDPKSLGGAVVDADVLAATLDMSSGAAQGSPKNGLGAVALADMNKALYELASQAIGSLKGGYDIALTANTVGGAGTIIVEATFIPAF